MQVLLFRHGIAEDAQPGQHDAERALTDRGHRRTVSAAAGLVRIADRPDALLTSPKLRAAQTAAILGEAFDLTPEPLDVLKDGPPQQVVRMLRGRSEDSLMLVGHEPWMSELIELLCGNRRPRGFIDLKKAGCALVEARLRRDEPPNDPALRWLIPPRVLRTLGK